MGLEDEELNQDLGGCRKISMKIPCILRQRDDRGVEVVVVVEMKKMDRLAEYLRGPIHRNR